jgi:hypothetical protein
LGLEKNSVLVAEMMVASSPKPLLVAVSERKIEMQEHIRTKGSDKNNSNYLVGLLNKTSTIYSDELIPAYKKCKAFPQSHQIPEWENAIKIASANIEQNLILTGISNADFSTTQLNSPVAVGGYIKSKNRSRRTNEIVNETFIVSSINIPKMEFIADKISPDTLIKTGDKSTFNFTGVGDAFEVILPSVVSIATDQLNELNKKDAWDKKEDARRILNYRAHERQDINPSGKEWEHVVEQSTAFPAVELHSASNLILASSSINNTLGKLFGGSKHEELSPALYFQKTIEGRLLVERWKRDTNAESYFELRPRNYLRGIMDFGYHKKWKYALYSSFGKSESSYIDKGRGKYKELN